MFAKGLGRIYCKVKVIHKEKEDPGLRDDIRLDLMVTSGASRACHLQHD